MREIQLDSDQCVGDARSRSREAMVGTITHCRDGIQHNSVRSDRFHSVHDDVPLKCKATDRLHDRHTRAYSTKKPQFH